MNKNTALSRFLISRRRKVTPEQIGLPPSGRRRVPHLRREEVALAADIGITWYTWLEQGRPIKIATGTLMRIATALRLDASETEYLQRLVRAEGHRHRSWHVPPANEIRELVERFTAGNAFVIGPRLDILTWNECFGRVFDLHQSAPGLARNGLWIMFTRLRTQNIFPNWEKTARQMVAMLRIEYGSYAGEAAFEDLIAELTQTSREFAAMWSETNVLSPTRWNLGNLRDASQNGEVAFETVTLPVPDSPGQTLIFHFPQKGRMALSGSVPSLS